MIILNQFQLTRHSMVPTISNFCGHLMPCPSTIQSHDHCHQDYHWRVLFLYILYSGIRYLGCGWWWSITIFLTTNCMRTVYLFSIPSRSVSHFIASFAIFLWWSSFDYIPNTPSDENPCFDKSAIWCLLFTIFSFSILLTQRLVSDLLYLMRFKQIIHVNGTLVLQQGD